MEAASSKTPPVSSSPVEARDARYSPPSVRLQVLQKLGRDARFEDDIVHYNYRRWVANEVNRAAKSARSVWQCRLRSTTSHSLSDAVFFDSPEACLGNGIP
ncbi:hypothetical protein EYZ11_010293 [Aspergillus tanneri]|uniref:Uncharacterized protein n=1 Tax=Aspergillus tanneri TaxID=1220188 RepID=A0A4S3J7V6_9EURO|nr:hypothetical protein EYZ11_010293 [Aspergillus tanneri]